MKQLFLVVAVVCGFLGWWFQSYTIEESMLNGAISFRYRVRRNWKGVRCHYGPIRMFYRNGTMGAESELFGAEVGSVDLLTGDSPRYWKDDGTSVSFEEWFMFFSLEYLPTQLTGESLRTFDALEKASSDLDK
jgi:hypothetical protein